MKKILVAAAFFIAVSATAQDVKPAEKGVVYGTVSNEANPVAAEELKSKLVEDKYEGQVKGKVVEVCKAEGCWLRIQRADGSPMMVRAKDHGFVMPQSLVGKTVLIEGNATVKEVSEEMRKHYAEDAGKSKKEIAKIKGAEKDVQFNATGVKVLD
ncbi:MAG TPA: DUF4920 domain-containing protein [Flavisolibacter sp.]|jgi:hypothetical protein|nr:DUF4920 domain-containing protein [Flavisolibacter sp.]